MPRYYDGSPSWRHDDECTPGNPCVYCWDAEEARRLEEEKKNSNQKEEATP